MISSERVNVILEKLGSPHRAVPGGIVDETMARLVEAIPAYIDREIERRLAERNDGWRRIETAPESRQIVSLRGRYPRSDEVVEIRGFYDDTGYTHGWADERYNTFYAEEWRP